MSFGHHDLRFWTRTPVTVATNIRARQFIVGRQPRANDGTMLRQQGVRECARSYFKIGWLFTAHDSRFARGERRDRMALQHVVLHAQVTTACDRYQAAAADSVFRPAVENDPELPTCPNAFDHRVSSEEDSHCCAACWPLVTRNHFFAPWGFLPTRLAALVPPHGYGPMIPPSSRSERNQAHCAPINASGARAVEAYPPDPEAGSNAHGRSWVFP